jgi:hypothetical protein
MEPSSNGEHVNHQQFPMKCEPSGELAFRIDVGVPDLRGGESAVATKELNMISRAEAIGPVQGRKPGDVVRKIRGQLGGRHDVPYMNIL